MVDKIFWNFYAFCYDSLLEFNPYLEMTDKIIKELNPNPGEKILDAGCGTGNLEILINKHCPNALISALDFSEAMLKRAKRKNRDNKKMMFSQYDLNNHLPFDNNYFDKIICINALYNLRDPESSLEEFVRVLKNDGVIILVTPLINSSPSLILKAHRHKNDSNENWRANNFLKLLALIFKAFGFTSVAIKFMAVAIFNKKLFKTMRVFKKDELDNIMIKAGLKIIRSDLVYGNQCIFTKAQKGGISEK